MDRRDPYKNGLWERTAGRGSSGFTLAELLVVVAIIIILAGILLPVLLQAKDTARMRTCSQNLRQLAQAFSMYLDDNNGFALPPPRAADWTLNPSPLIKYTKDPPVTLKYKDDAYLPSENNPKRVWICPGDRGMNGEPPRWCYNSNKGGMLTSSYCYLYEAYLASSGHTDVSTGRMNRDVPRRPEQWARPTRDVLFCDYASSFHRGTKSNANPTDAVSGSDNVIKCVNFVMLDGHAISGTRANLLGTTSTGMDSLRAYALVYDNPYNWGYEPSHRIPGLGM